MYLHNIHHHLHLIPSNIFSVVLPENDSPNSSSKGIDEFAVQGQLHAKIRGRLTSARNVLQLVSSLDQGGQLHTNDRYFQLLDLWAW